MNFTKEKKSRISQIADQFKDGPIEDRKCTDKPFCLLFILWFMFSLGYMVSAFHYKNIDRLFMPVDNSSKYFDNTIRKPMWSRGFKGLQIFVNSSTKSSN